MRDNYTVFTMERYEFVVEYLEENAGDEPFCITELFFTLPRGEFHLDSRRKISCRVDSWLVREVVMDLLSAGLIVPTLTPSGNHGGRKYYRIKRGLQWNSADRRQCVSSSQQESMQRS